MNKFVKILASLVIAFLPTVTFAQTTDTKWVKLYDFFQDPTLVLSSPEDVNRLMYCNPAYSEFNIIPISKVALNPNAPKREVKDGKVQNTNLQFILKDFANPGGKYVVEQSFDINDNGKKTKSKKIEPNADGWKVYDFNKALVLSDIVDALNPSETELAAKIIKIPYSNSHVYDQIYVALEPSLIDQWEKDKTSYKKSITEYRLLKTSQQLIRSDNLENGIICEHYSNDVYGALRTYRKPNGDFLTIKELADSRDPKTLDAIKGIDRTTFEDKDNLKSIGAFKVTTANSGTAEYDGAFLTIKTPDGGIFESYIKDTVNIDAKDFLNDYNVAEDEILTSLISSNLGKLFSIHNFQNRASFDKFIELYGTIALEHVSHFDLYSRFYAINPAFGIKRIGYQAYSAPFASDGLITNLTDRKLTLNNGDHLTIEGREVTELRLTLPDGRVFEKFPDNKSLKVTYPNGDKLIEDINNWRFAMLFNLTELEPKNGIVYTADGKEIKYVNGLNPEQQKEKELAEEQYRMEREKAEKEKEKQWNEDIAKREAYANQLRKKYGARNVDNALAGNYKVGMSYKMIFEIYKNIGMIRIYDDGQTAGTDWYKLLNLNSFQTCYIGVNRKTQNIIYISRSRNARL